MKAKLIQQPLSVRKSPVEGYGVFAEKDFAPDEVIEECVALVTPNSDPAFASYYFHAGKQSCIATGFGSLYNHAADPNASYVFDAEHRLIVVTAKRAIARDEEIFITYGKDWFSARNLPVKKISAWRKFWRFFIGVPLRGLVLAGLIYLIIIFLKNNLVNFAHWILIPK